MRFGQTASLLCVCTVLMVLAPVSVVVGQPTPSVTYQLRAKDFDTSDTAQLLVTGDIPAASGAAEVQFISPPGFEISPSTLTFDPQSGKRIIVAKMKLQQNAPSGESSILVHATVKPPGNGPSIAIDQVIPFVYIRRLPLKFYFLAGLTGFVLGYLLRLVTGVLKTVPAPLPAPPIPDGGGSSQDGRITAYVKKHYYRVDFFVCFTLAFAVLLYLIRDGHAPDSAATWYGAILTGVGLGFLTNNDLIGRIRT